MIEEADQDRWLPLPTPQIAMQLIAKLTRRSGAAPARGVGLDIMVQQLHRVQLRALAGQKVQLDALGMAPNPGADQLGAVHGMAVHNQMHPPPTAIA